MFSRVATFAVAVALASPASALVATRRGGDECKLCRLAGDDAPTMYMRARPVGLEFKLDGIGGTTHTLLFGMAFAAKHGMNFGGMLPESSKSGASFLMGGRDAQAVAVKQKAVTSFFGLASPDRLFVSKSPTFDVVLDTPAEIHHFEGDANATSVLLDTAKYPLEDKDRIDRYITTEFLEAFRAQAKPALDASLAEFNAFNQSRGPTVALHLRRGEVGVGDVATWRKVDSKKRFDGRFTENEWYYTMIEHIRNQLPDADIHLWSSSEGNYDVTNFDSFTKRGVTVHLDGDPLNAWAHFATAKIFVMARSAFSHIPAMLSHSCVLYQHWTLQTCRGPVIKWTNTRFMDDVGNQKSAEFEAGLKKCIARM